MLTAAWVEFTKLRRSRTVWIINAVGMLVPLLTAALVVSVRLAAPQAEGVEAEALATLLDPDWEMFMTLGAQLLTQGLGLMLYSLMAAFVFAREYRENTYASLMMLPTPRWKLVFAKFAALFAWMTLLAFVQLALALPFGALAGVGAPDLAAVAWGLRYFVGISWLSFMALPVMAALACAGRGYLAPMTLATGVLIAGIPLSTSQLMEWVPWAVPTAYLVARGQLGILGGVVLVLTFVIGAAATVAHYRFADVRS